LARRTVNNSKVNKKSLTEVWLPHTGLLHACEEDRVAKFGDDYSVVQVCSMRHPELGEIRFPPYGAHAAVSIGQAGQLMMGQPMMEKPTVGHPQVILYIVKCGLHYPDVDMISVRVCRNASRLRK